MQELVKRLYRLVDSITHYVWFLAPLLTRILVGYTFYLTGYGKTNNADFHANLVELMRSNHVPWPEANAWFVGYLEWFGAILLIAGLLTRLTALALSTTMGVALLTQDRNDFLTSWLPSSDKGPSDIGSFVMLCYLIWLVMFGAGACSLDALFGPVLRRWSGTPQAETGQKPGTD